MFYFFILLFCPLILVAPATCLTCLLYNMFLLSNTLVTRNDIYNLNSKNKKNQLKQSRRQIDQDIFSRLVNYIILLVIYFSIIIRGKWVEIIFAKSYTIHYIFLI